MSPANTSALCVPCSAAAPCSFGLMLTAALYTRFTSSCSSGGSAPMFACSTLKKRTIISTESGMTVPFPAACSCSGVVAARSRRNPRHAAMKGRPRVLRLEWSHFSRLRYSRRAASAARSMANEYGVESSTSVSAFSSWHTSRMRGMAPLSLACMSTMASSTALRLRGHRRCSTTAELGWFARYVGSSAAYTSSCTTPQSVLHWASPMSRTSGQCLTGCSKMVRTTAKCPFSANMINDCSRSRESQH
mmetsp:Transcript_1559/g.3166  ORF Transcript_1559/g.3166 Transcript_1559/m.3166 type:complete len:247 (+) Transcript_1559:621-1361(+)